VSFRPSVDRPRIERFLRELGRAFRHPARLFIVGGTTLVYERLRESTLDIDYALEVANEHHGEFMRQLARLKDQLAVNVEEASPADFIPLPSGWRNRAQFVDRFGQIDVFHYDLVSTALSKLGRGHERDLTDVRLLLDANLITVDEIERGWQEVKAQLPDRGWSGTEVAEFEASVVEVLSDRSSR
jgi:hypothetical protein